MLQDKYSDHPVEVEMVGDYNVELAIEGLPSGCVAVDYYQGEPRLLIRDADIDVVNASEETVAISIDPRHD